MTYCIGVESNRATQGLGDSEPRRVLAVRQLAVSLFRLSLPVHNASPSDLAVNEQAGSVPTDSESFQYPFAQQSPA